MSNYELESMVGTFLGSMEFFWSPTNEQPAIVANRIDSLSAGLDDMLFPMVAARQIAIDDIKEHFDNEEGPDGQKWEEWQPDYAKNKESGTKLRRDETEDLYQAVTDERAYPIVGDDLFINTADFPPYWHIHNEGGKAGKGASIPERNFLGLSETAGFAIIDVFDDWMARELRINVSPLTGIAQAFEGNRFGGRIGLRGRARSGMLRPPGVSWSSGFSEMDSPFNL